MTNAKTHSQRFREGILCHVHVPDEPASNRAMTFFPKTTRVPITQRPHLFPHRARPALASIRLLSLGLGDALGQDLSILILVSWSAYENQQKSVEQTYRLILHFLGLAALERNAVTLVLQALRSDQTLDARSLGIRLLALALWLDLATNYVLADLFAVGNSSISFEFLLRLYPNCPT